MGVVDKGDMIKILYTGRFDDNIIFDTTDEQTAKDNDISEENVKYGSKAIIVGEGNLLEGFEEDVIGKEVGYGGSVEISPDKAFGERNPALLETVPITKFSERPRPGAQVDLDGRMGIVETVIGRRARVDFNHPFAGKTICYDYTIEEKIEDAEEKVKTILDIYAGTELDAKIEDKKISIEVPYHHSFNQRLIFSKRMMSDKLIEYLGVDEVLFVERFVGHEKAAEDQAADGKEKLDDSDAQKSENGDENQASVSE